MREEKEEERKERKITHNETKTNNKCQKRGHERGLSLPQSSHSPPLKGLDVSP